MAYLASLQKRSRHILSGFLALTLLLPLLLMVAVQLWQGRVQHAMEEALEEKALQQVFIPSGGLVWEKPGKEIRLDGRLFDVKELHPVAGGFQVRGLFDEQETRIRDFLSRHALTGSDLLLTLLLLSGAASGITFFIFIPTARGRSSRRAGYRFPFQPQPFHMLLVPPPKSSSSHF